MDEYFEINRKHWDDLVPIHRASDFYDVTAFKEGRTSLKETEVEEVGPVTGRSLLHLQCHFGMDSLSWARAGATVTGADFSPAAIAAARALASDTNIDARFIESDLYALPDKLDERFDIVFTS